MNDPKTNVFNTPSHLIKNQVERYKRWQYRNTALLILGLTILFYFVDSHIVQSSISRIGDFGYFGAFATGVFFVSTFTVAPAIYVLYSLADILNPIYVAIFAGLGALLGDYLIFRFIKDRIFNELKPIFNMLGGNYDIRLMMVLVVIVGVITLISDMFLRWRFFGFGDRDNREGGGQIQMILFAVAIIASILAPIGAMLIQLAISRKREFLADSSGALLTRYPDGLASALEKISQYNLPVKKASNSTAHLYIATPFGKKQSYFSKIFSTHPPISERVQALRGVKSG